MPLEDPNPRTPDDDSLIKGGNWLSKRIENLICRVTPWLTRFKMRAHFLMCCYCRRYMENLHYMRRLFRSSPSSVEISSERLSPEAKERLKQTLRDHRA